MSTHDITKLPKWAQDELRRLRMREDEEKAREASIVKPAPPMIGCGRCNHAPYAPSSYLSAQDVVVFFSGDGREEYEVRFEQPFALGRQGKFDTISVRTKRGMLRVIPSSGNSVLLESY